MKKNKTWMIFAVLLVGIVGGAYILYGQLGKQNSSERIVQEETNEKKNVEDDGEKAEQSAQAPDFAVVDQEGEEVSLSDFSGKPVILNLWATWCNPCKMEMPEFEKMYEKYGEEIQFMMVNLSDNYRSSVQEAKQFVEEEGYTFPVYFDTKTEASEAYQVFSIPATYFINEEGIIVAHGNGALDGESLQKGIDLLMK